MVAAADAVVPSNFPVPVSEPLRFTATAANREATVFLILTGCYLGYLPARYARHWIDAGTVMKAILPEYYTETVEYRSITLRTGPPNLVLETFWKLLHHSDSPS